ncbi:MAG: hypothetical protein IPI24_06025 [Ignavibacteria bacterium]|nr:hypothetical protein [Ignavibacteria bacterium]
MPIRMFRTIVSIAVLTLLLVSCADYADGPYHPRDDDDDRTDTTDTTGGNDSTVCFTRDVLPILISNCTMAECHDAVRPEEEIDLTSYTSIMSGKKTIIKPGNPNDSKLYESLVEDESDERMPPPPRSLSQAQIDLIARWIREGAKNRDCSADPATCDTVNVLYTTHVEPMMARYCNGCHSGDVPEAGIDLSQRATVETYARNGMLVGTMSHSAGFLKMPPSGPRVSDCTIGTVHAWISQGLR